MTSRTRQTQICFITAAIVFTGGCNALQTKEQIGTDAGAVVGAIVGGVISDNKIVGAAIGGALGGLVGNRIGAYLDEQDQQRMTAATEQSILTGQDQTWVNPEKGTTGQAKVKQETRQTATSVSVLKYRIKEVPPLDIVGAIYKLNVRGGLGTDYIIIDNLKAGQNINVVGQVQGRIWYMVSQDGFGSGFIHHSLLVPSPGDAVVNDAPVAQEEITTVNTTTAKTCRTIQQTITLQDGTEHEEEITTAYQGSNVWELV